jgi:iron complex outermembrane receptor protein
MIRGLILIIGIASAFSAVAQQESRLADSTKVLSEVVIEAYQYDRTLSEIPASIGLVNEKDIQRFNATSILPAINTVPGVRMEERSPGSYRLAIRGSSLRSPFGVRNVKVYWNGLPFTDAGGNTYINLFDQTSFQQAEIVKGPGTSLYGAGTGGVLLLKNTPAKSGASIGATVGSYGLLQYNAQANLQDENTSIRIGYAHQESDGYRQQTKMARDVIQAQGDFAVNEKGTLSTSILYSDLYYQTPGALTRQLFDADPKQARPSGAAGPGAVEQHATIYNKTFYSGLSYNYRWNNKWSNRTGVYGTVTKFDNPTIRNYERRAEQGFGGRTNTQYDFTKGKVNFGGEYQHSFSPVKVYFNEAGQIGALQTDDEISINTYFAFAQAELFLPHNFFVTLGASLNKLNVDFIRLSDTPAFEADRNFDLVFSPRIALLKKVNSDLSIHASYSQGYSPPTVQELYPSAGYFDQSLKPERGNNIELGVRGTALNKTLSFDVVAYNFNLDETIVVRRLEDSGEYFVNSGETNQRGAEVQLGWSPTLAPQSLLADFRIWTSYTFNDYTFDNYEKDGVSFDGNDLTGVARNIGVAGIDALIALGLYVNVNYTYTDRIPLNDANTEYADSYSLLTGRAGFRKAWKNLSLDIFGGVDNALDEKYSLGNDLNAIGGRYYNAAPGINYFGGVKTGWTLE